MSTIYRNINFYIELLFFLGKQEVMLHILYSFLSIWDSHRSLNNHGFSPA